MKLFTMLNHWTPFSHFSFRLFLNSWKKPTVMKDISEGMYMKTRNECTSPCSDPKRVDAYRKQMVCIIVAPTDKTPSQPYHGM